MRRVLVCERALSHSDRYREVLEKSGFSVTETAEPSDALKLIEKQSYHACIWGFTEIENLAKISQLKLTRPGTPVIATGSD